MQGCGLERDVELHWQIPAADARSEAEFFDAGRHLLCGRCAFLKWQLTRSHMLNVCFLFTTLALSLMLRDHLKWARSRSREGHVVRKTA